MKSLFPHDRIKSAYDVDYKALKAAGIKAIFFDIDNTLVFHDAPSDENSKALIERIHNEGLIVYLISNNKEPRVKSFKEASMCDGYVFKAGKPLARGFNQALKELNIYKEEAVFFGDQIYTDVIGGRNAKLWTILTKPLSAKEPFNIVLKRIIEFPILLLYVLIRIFIKPSRPMPLIKGE